MKKKRNKKKIPDKELMEINLELARKFLLEIIEKPEKLNNLPSNATIILYPVNMK